MPDGRRGELASATAAVDRQPALEGIRAVAVLAVVAFHAEAGWAAGGFLGVDVFFVLSGYLITTRLVGERRTEGRIDLAAFWARRARRIAPALLVLVGGLAVLGAVGALPPRSVGRLPADALAALLSVANWRFLATDQGYFAATSAKSLLEHTWSLSIEEQFYVVWPLGLSVVLGRTVRGAGLGGRPARARPVLPLVGMALTAASAGWMWHLAADPASRSAAYWDTFARLHGPLAGGVLALVLASPSGRTGPRARPVVPSLVAGAGLVGLAVSFHSISTATAFLYPGAFVVAELATAAVIAGLVLAPSGPVARVMALGPLRALGRISYGVYLWHWPLLFVVTKERTGFEGVPLHALRFVLTLAAAAASHLLVERPVLERRAALGPTAVAILGTGSIVLLGVALIPAPPAGPGVADLVVPERAAFAAPGDARGPIADEPAEANGPPAAPGTTPGSVPGTSPPSTRPRPPAFVPRAGPPVRIAVFGDSVAQSLAAALRPQGPGYNVEVIDSATQGCGVMRVGPYLLTGVQYPIFDPCVRWRSTWEQRLVQHRPDVAVFALGRHEVLDRVFEGRWTSIGDPGFDAYVRSEIEAAVAIARQHAVPVVILTAPFFVSSADPGGSVRPENTPARVHRFNEIARAVAATNPDVVQLVDLGALVSPDGMYADVIDGVQIRSDGVHFAQGAGTWLAPWLVPDLVEAAR